MRAIAMSCVRVVFARSKRVVAVLTVCCVENANARGEGTLWRRCVRVRMAHLGAVAACEREPRGPYFVIGSPAARALTHTYARARAGRSFVRVQRSAHYCRWSRRMRVHLRAKTTLCQRQLARFFRIDTVTSCWIRQQPLLP